MGATGRQIEWLKSLPYYGEMVEVLGEYDNEIDYVGPSDWRRGLIPRSICGVDVNICAYIHDFFYTIGGTDTDRLKADLLFRYDIERWIKKKRWNWFSRWAIRPLAMRLAHKYYLAVRCLGDKSFNYRK